MAFKVGDIIIRKEDALRNGFENCSGMKFRILSLFSNECRLEPVEYSTAHLYRPVFPMAYLGFFDLAPEEQISPINIKILSAAELAQLEIDIEEEWDRRSQKKKVE